MAFNDVEDFDEWKRTEDPLWPFGRAARRDSTSSLYSVNSSLYSVNSSLYSVNSKFNFKSCNASECPTPSLQSEIKFEQSILDNEQNQLSKLSTVTLQEHLAKLQIRAQNTDVDNERDQTRPSSPIRQGTLRSTRNVMGDDTIPEPAEKCEKQILQNKHPTTRDESYLPGKEKLRAEPAQARESTNWFNLHDQALKHVLRLTKGQTANVKIALLDTGLELSEYQMDQYGLDTKSVKYHSLVDSGPELKWRDEDGHGTHLAVLLHKIAPNAILHITRVFKKRDDMNEKRAARKVSSAIKHAVDFWNVDIIIMAFGFNKMRGAVSKSLAYASFKNVLVFAAASNEGKNHAGGIAYPASETSVFCVHSGDGDGNRSKFTPPATDDNRIMVLGESIKSAWPLSLSAGGSKLRSGTSCAAAIAAGIAALVLECAGRFLNKKKMKKLRRYSPIQRVFEQMKAPNTQDGYWWILHGQFFQRKEGWIEDEFRKAINLGGLSYDSDSDSDSDSDLDSNID